EGYVPLHRLPEGSRILERKAFFAERVAVFHPRAPAAARGAAVAFVDEDEVVPLEGIDGDRLVAHLVLELRDLDDLDRLARKEPPPLLAEDFGLNARPFELAQMLLRKPLVGRKQNDTVQRLRSPMRFEIALVLQDVRVHEQRLAAAGGHPEGDLVELEARVLG